nr:MAG TPA: PGRP protein [Caudoviricetes sp.]
MDIKKQLATRNDCYRRNQAELAKSPANRDSRYARYYQGPRGVMVHSTGANNPNLRRYVQPDDGILGRNPNANDWNRPGLEVCVHAFIGLTQTGDVAAYQILPWEYRAWHCGGDANDTHLSFEICEDNLGDRDYFWSTYLAAVALTAELCRKFGLDPLAPGVVIDHAEGARLGIASNHADTGHWWGEFGITMDDFRADVAEDLAAITRPLYRVRRTWADKDSQIGAFADLAKAKAACPIGYSVFDPAGKAIYTNTGKDDINMSKDEVQKMINDAVANATPAQKDPVVYQSLEKVPEYGRPTIAKLVDKGALKGTGQGLGLTTDMVRILTVLDRLGKLD